jgi:hypothetical protein
MSNQYYYKLFKEAAEVLLDESFKEEADRLLETAVSDVGSNELGVLLLYAEVQIEEEKVSAANLIFDDDIKGLVSPICLNFSCAREILGMRLS